MSRDANTFPSILDSFTDLASEYLSTAKDLPGADPKALATRSDGFDAQVKDVEANLEKCLVSLPDGQQIWGWEYEALEQLAKDNGKEFESFLDAIIVEECRVVKARFNEMGLADISALSNFINLKELDLARNQIRDLSPLSPLAELNRLHIQCNKIEELSSIVSLLRLEKLYLFSNPVRDLSLLTKLSKLNYVMVSGEHLSSDDRSALAELQARRGFKCDMV